MPQDVISFTYDGAPVRLYLNVHTHLPTAIDYSGPMARDGYWRLLGDVTMRTYYSFWWIGEGVRLPMQWDVYRNGLHDSSFAIESLSINPAVDGKDMSISPELHAAFDKSAAAPAKLALQAPIAIAPGVTFIPGSWNVLLVRQSDGVVVIEAPISNAYSELVIAEVKRLYPRFRSRPSFQPPIPGHISRGFAPMSGAQFRFIASTSTDRSLRASQQPHMPRTPMRSNAHARRHTSEPWAASSHLEPVQTGSNFIRSRGKRANGR